MDKWMKGLKKWKWASTLAIVLVLSAGVLYGSGTYRFDVPKGLTVGDILYANRTDRMTNLNAGTSGYVLTANGAGAAPSYQAVAGTVTALTASKPVFSDANRLLTSTGTMPVNQGGTGLTTYAVGDIPYASAATTISKLAGVDAGKPLVSGGVATAPLYALYTLSGTAAQTYTFPGATATLQSTIGTPAGFIIASQGTGDILQSSSASAWARLGLGLQGTGLESTGSAVAYVAKNIYRQAAIHNFATLAVSWTMSADELLCLMHATTNASGAACTIQAAGAAGMKMHFRNGSGQNNTIHSGAGTGILVSTATAVDLIYDAILGDWVKMGTAVTQ
jgi:hypothetical protein